MKPNGSRTALASKPWSPWISRSYSLAHLSRALAAIAMVLATRPTLAPAQSVGGAMAVAATVLPPDRTRPPRLISFSVARTGIARLETAAPIAGAVSQIVMVTISSPTNSFAPVAQAPTLVMATPGRHRSGAATTRSDGSPAQRLAYDVDVGRSPVDSNLGAVSVRIEYLIVPGT